MVSATWMLCWVFSLILILWAPSKTIIPVFLKAELCCKKFLSQSQRDEKQIYRYLRVKIDAVASCYRPLFRKKGGPAGRHRSGLVIGGLQGYHIRIAMGYSFYAVDDMRSGHIVSVAQAGKEGQHKHGRLHDCDLVWLLRHPLMAYPQIKILIFTCAFLIIQTILS